MPFPERVHLFCRVVDNFGDIGICWRLTRQLVEEHAIPVTLWIDDLIAFRKICAEIDTQKDEQVVRGGIIRRWLSNSEEMSFCEIGDIVIEAFGCELPANYVAEMAKKAIKPVWINLEYLSAESWVESCHEMPSPHPFLSLKKYFFFPGFSDKTGGLLAERNIIIERVAFQKNLKALDEFWARLGVSFPEGARKVSLFCYPHAPLEALFSAMQSDVTPTLCLVPEGVASDEISTFTQRAPTAGVRVTQGALTLHILPFIDQQDYDRLLWACDLNFVRGEDSFVRAQWAGRPFVWHIYPQDNNAHWVKLEAFMDYYEQDMLNLEADTVTGLWRAWNGIGHLENYWPIFGSIMPDLRLHADQWARKLSKNEGLASKLIRFARRIG